MGFTTLGGAIIGTRAGDHAAALDFYMMQKEDYSPQEIDSILNKKSGLLGITGKYIDRRNVIKKRLKKGKKRASLAVEMEVLPVEKIHRCLRCSSREIRRSYFYSWSRGNG